MISNAKSNPLMKFRKNVDCSLKIVVVDDNIILIGEGGGDDDDDDDDDDDVDFE